MADLYGHPNLKIFKQFGYIPQGTSGPNQSVGYCPFCGRDKHFFVNPERKTWDCKSCHREGGYQKFLRQMHEYAQDNFRGKAVRKLSQNRGLEVSTLKRAGIGFLPELDIYTIPIWDVSKKSLWNLRLYKKKRLHNASGSTAGLYGWDAIKSDHDFIWLCEGEWDRLAMVEILESLEIDNQVAVGLPGATTFKNDWLSYFEGKVVYVVLDNDFDKEDKKGNIVEGAGKSGAKKLYNMLTPVAREVRFVNWPDTKGDKYDLRDLYLDNDQNAKVTYRQLGNFLKPLPKGVKDDELSLSGSKEAPIKYKGPGLSAEKTYDAYRKWLYLPNTSGIDIMFGALLGNRLPGDPIWLFLVGSSGSGKTDLIMSTKDAPGIVSISSLTPKTLISGSVAPGGGDASLVPKLNGKILCIKDFTTILDMNAGFREEIFAQLRDCFDGECAKPFGVGALKSYKSKFGIVAGVTRVIELFTEGQSALGERFLRHNLPNSDPVELMRRALSNVITKDKSAMRDELREVANMVLDHDYGSDMEVSELYSEKIICLAQYVATMRGTVMRDKYSKEITHRPFIELPTRLVTQLMKLSIGVALFQGKDAIDAEVYNLIKRTARSSAPSRLELIVRKIWKIVGVDPFTDADISAITNLPAITAKRLAENMHQLKVLERVHRNKKDKSLFGVSTWQLTERIVDLIERSNIYPRRRT